MPSEDDLIEAAPCPSCQSPLTVSVADLGHLVECPACGTQFRARRTGTPAASPPPPRRDEDEPRPSSRGRDEGRDDDRPRRPARRGRFDDRDLDDRDRDDAYPDDRRRKGTPGSVIALAVMHFVYAGLLLLCGVLGMIVLLVGANRFRFQGGPEPNEALEGVLAVLYLVTGGVMLAAGVMALQRKGWGLSAAALGLAAVSFLGGVVNAVVTIQRNRGNNVPEETMGLVCGISILAVFWLGYLVTNGILLAKAGRHFR